jgi:hypothetical protein
MTKCRAYLRSFLSLSLSFTFKSLFVCLFYAFEEIVRNFRNMLSSRLSFDFSYLVIKFFKVSVMSVIKTHEFWETRRVSQEFFISQKQRLQWEKLFFIDSIRDLKMKVFPMRRARNLSCKPENYSLVQETILWSPVARTFAKMRFKFAPVAINKHISSRIWSTFNPPNKEGIQIVIKVELITNLFVSR